MISEETKEMLDEIIEEYGLKTYDQAIRQLGRKVGYDV